MYEEDKIDKDEYDDRVDRFNPFLNKNMNPRTYKDRYPDDLDRPMSVGDVVGFAIVIVGLVWLAIIILTIGN